MSWLKSCWSYAFSTLIKFYFCIKIFSWYNQLETLYTDEQTQFYQSETAAAAVRLLAVFFYIYSSNAYKILDLPNIEFVWNARIKINSLKVATRDLQRMKLSLPIVSLGFYMQTRALKGQLKKNLWSSNERHNFTKIF